MPTNHEITAKIERFFYSPQVFTRPSELPPGCPIPPEWNRLLGMSGSDLQSGLTSMWHTAKDSLPEAVAFVTTSVTDVSIVRDLDEYALLYAYRSESVGRRYYIGWPPNQGRPHERVERAWPMYPAGLKQFLSHIHDGWVDLTSDALGPLPTRSMSFLSEPDWDMVCGPEVPLGWQWKDILTILSNGAGDYLCLDVGNILATGEAGSHVHFHEEVLEPERRFDFLSVMNAWIQIGVEDALPR